ncbi:hypothetical protein [Mycobacterium tuberculosis]|uniref:hypothetical protein n=1 Tax=Mycobacterium tuberculosis TaxID=1773 RepID=UPI001877F968|nr:hypothetical protein [Mycobacterium tuberculosis]
MTPSFPRTGVSGHAGAVHVLATGRPYQDLGADYFTTRMDPDKERRRLVAKLEAQGLGVTLEPAA